ncbi:MAG: DUF3078 domain-containing protein [Flavobacteriaceae bacterium]|nr:DUF3078 domain-containing protein [Flavobacteriaceae bacterium]
MKNIFFILIAIFYGSLTSAQITDSIKTIKTIDKVRVIKTIDTSVMVINNALTIGKLRLLKGIGTTLISSDIDSLKMDSIKAQKFVYIKKSLLDSLLKPFYRTSIDTVANIDSISTDTLASSIKYIPKFRTEINPFTLDTSYIPLPKAEKNLIIKNNYTVDILEIKNPINRVRMNKLNYVRDSAWWTNRNSIGLNINEVAFLNWNAGGENSISGLLKVYFGKTYRKRFTLWENEIFIRYGLNQREARELRKTDDEIRINSTFGYRKNELSDWYFSMKFNFRTQFTNGYKYPNVSNPISRLFAPAYMFLGAGTQYNLARKHFSIYLSPVTLKSTFVFDEDLSNDGAFGVKIGERSRHEFGALIQSNWDTEIFKNVAMYSSLSFYTDYLNNFGNIDVNWELKFKLMINQFIEANIGLSLLYDDDIKFKEDTNGNGQLETLGARLQLRQSLGIGALYRF